MNTRSCLAAGFSLMAAFGLQARNYTWIGGTEGAWSTAANWVADDDSSVHAVPSSGEDSATLSCADGDITIVCNNGNSWLEPGLVFKTNVTFEVASGTCYMKGVTSGTGSLTKTGDGTLELNGKSSRSGWTYVLGGVLVVGNERVLGQDGGCIVGDGVNPAELKINRDVNWPARIFGPNDGSGDLIVKSNSILSWDAANANQTTANMSNFTLEKGAVARMGSHMLQNVNQLGVYTFAGEMYGLTSSVFKAQSGTLYVPAGRTNTFYLPVAGLTSQYQYINGYLCAKLKTDGGDGLEVDFHMPGTITDVWDARDGLDIIGSGTVKISGNNSTYGGNASNQGNTRVQSGRLLVDNTEGSGTGYSKVVVSAGATLGGVGFIGGLTTDKIYSGSGRFSAYPTDPCVVVNGAVDNPGVLAPGSYEDTTNARIYGTLTVGSAEAPSSVTMNANTKLAFEVGKGGATGLKVYGPLTLGTGVTLDVNVAEKAKSGDYVLVSATEGITGNYTITGNVKPTKVVQIGNEIILHVRNGLTLFVR